MESTKKKFRFHLPEKGFFLAVALLTVLYSLFMIGAEGPVSGTDVFLFKQPGVNYAQQGSLVVKNLPHAPYGQEVPYSYYPPLFPLAYGIWTKVTGIGIKQSLAFDFALRLLRTILLFFILYPLYARSPTKKLRFAFSVLFAISLLSGDRDRPDELGLIFGLSSWLLLMPRSDLYWRLIVGGVFLGLCGATSPACGVFFALGALPLRLGLTRSLAAMGIVGLFAATIFLVCTIPMQAGDGMSRFSSQLPLSLVPYSLPFFQGSFWNFLNTFGQALARTLSVGSNYLFCAFVLLPLTFWAWKKHPQRKQLRSFRSFLFVPPFFAVFCIFIWTLQPYYFWFVCVSLTIAALALLLTLEEEKKLERALIFGVALAYLPLMMSEAKQVFFLTQRSSATCSAKVAEEVLKVVKPQHRLAISADQFFTFRGKREIDNIDYICYKLNDYDYVYETPKTTRWSGSPELSCTASIPCFEPVLDLREKKPVQLAGIELPFRARSNGGVLYENRNCRKRSKNPINLADESNYLRDKFSLWK